MKYYKFLVRNITRSYITYVILFSIIAYAIIAYSVSQDYTHGAETSVHYVSNNVSEALAYSTNITGFLQEFPAISDFISSADQAEMSQNAIESFNTLRTISSSAANYLSDIALVNLPTDTILTSSGSYQLGYYAQHVGLSPEELRSALESFILHENILPWIKTSVVKTPTQSRH